jgi:transcriptional regulator with XRE-family HTH domain
MGRKSRFTSKALDYAFDRYIGTERERVESFEEELVNAELARKIYDLRTRADLTQKELAALVGTTASVISRLEDADYDGHSLAMLRRIAAALNKRVEIRFVSVKPATKPRSRRDIATRLLSHSSVGLTMMEVLRGASLSRPEGARSSPERGVSCPAHGLKPTRPGTPSATSWLKRCAAMGV